MSNNITRAKTVAIARALSKKLETPFEDLRFRNQQATVIEGAHEGSSSAFIISWEEAPLEDWVSSDLLEDIVSKTTGGKFYPEAINHWSVGFFPTGL